jgi:shikimate dehydrogenase
MISSKTKLLCLIGNPAGHSLSPKIQNYFLGKNNIDAVYVTFEPSPADIENAFMGAKNLGFKGMNVTMPFKESVYKFLDRPDNDCRLTGSVNTVNFSGKNHISEGFNSDVSGFIMSLDNKGFPWKQSSCLVLGAGGTAKSTVLGLLKKNVNRVYLYNRTRSKAEKIKDKYKETGSHVIKIIKNLDSIKEEIVKTRLIVNCTPLGMEMNSYRNVLPIPEYWDLGGKYIFEMVYYPVKTRLIKKAESEGAEVIDGLDMLINQGAMSFFRWFGIVPGTGEIKTIINKELEK